MRYVTEDLNAKPDTPRKVGIHEQFLSRELNPSGADDMSIAPMLSACLHHAENRLPRISQ
jgi:hypothetical protein